MNTCCVAAIDFGTANTGIAFAFRSNPGEIYIKEPGGQSGTKTRTYLLLDEHGTFLNFGSAAVDSYFEDNHDNRDYLFDKFKMNLLAPTKDSKATALNGKAMPLIEVIAKFLKYVKNALGEEINKSQISTIQPRDIQWILTVPAIWEDNAKAIMRKAAYNAGLVDDECSPQLELVLEPEAAGAACEADEKALEVGDVFMVLDCGGGTVDITVHRVLQKVPNMLLEEVCQPSGGPWGSTYIDAQFENLLEKLVGPEAFRRFKPSPGWVEVMRNWETAKIGYNPTNTSAMTRSVNISGALDFAGGKSLKTLVEMYNSAHGCCLSVQGSSVLKLPIDLIASFFDKLVTQTVSHVKDILKVQSCVKYVFAVGGFAESPCLQQHVKSSLEGEGRRVIVPQRAGLAVLKGAVLLGLSGADRFASRVAKFTYAVSCFTPFDRSDPAHASRRKVERMNNGNRISFVGGKLSIIVAAGTSTPTNQVHEGENLRIRDERSPNDWVISDLYTSESPSAQWVDDAQVKKIGRFKERADPGDLVRFDLRFGATELLATFVNVTKGTSKACAIEFLASHAERLQSSSSADAQKHEWARSTSADAQRAAGVVVAQPACRKRRNRSKEETDDDQDNGEIYSDEGDEVEDDDDDDDSHDDDDSNDDDDENDDEEDDDGDDDDDNDHDDEVDEEEEESRRRRKRISRPR